MRALLILFLSVITLQSGSDMDAAKKAAKEQNKLILLNFSGSDWCGPCIMLRKEYLESEVFKVMAKSNLIMVNADFPRKKKNQLSPEQVKKNEALAEKYNKEGFFPYTLLLDANGKVLKTWKGKPEISAEKWTQEIKAICTASK